MSDAAKGNPSAAWSQGARKRQEDFCLYDYLDGDGDLPSILLVVADGMGGQSAGDVASRTACDAFAEKARSAADRDAVRMLRDSLEEANAALQAKLEADRALSGMGTTLVAVLVEGDRAHWISIGDSIFYLLRQSCLKRINADHSLAGLYAEQVAKGEITQAEADERGGQNQLRSALMGEPLKLIDQSTHKNSLSLEQGDVLLLASDGLLTLEHAQIEDIADRHSHSARGLAEALIDAIHAARAPHQDNTTVIAYVHAGDAQAAKTRAGWRMGRKGAALAGLVAVVLLAGISYALLFTGLHKSAAVTSLMQQGALGTSPVKPTVKPAVTPATDKRTPASRDEDKDAVTGKPNPKDPSAKAKKS